MNLNHRDIIITFNNSSGAQDHNSNNLPFAFEYKLEYKSKSI